MLWQIPNWTEMNTVTLAGWLYENYQYEPLEVIVNCLKNPPVSEKREDNTWRLTPDVVAQWMTAALERQAIRREMEHERIVRNENKMLETYYNSEQGQAWKKFYEEHFFKFNEARKKAEDPQPEKNNAEANELERFKLKYKEAKRINQERINRASSEFYKTKEEMKQVQTWEHPQGYYILAITEEDGLKIFESVKLQKMPEL